MEPWVPDLGVNAIEDSPRRSVCIAGSQKCGTTTLLGLLRSTGLDSHTTPEFAPLLRPRISQNAMREELAAHGLTKPESIVVKSAGAAFVRGPGLDWLVAERPATTFVFMTRAPEARVRSAHRHMWAVGRERVPLRQALELETARLTEDFERNHPLAYRARSDYLAQIDHLESLVDSAHVLVFDLEDLRSDPLRVVNCVRSRIGLAAVADANAAYQNAASSAESPLLARLMRDRSRSIDALVRTLPAGARLRAARAARSILRQRSTGNEPKQETFPIDLVDQSPLATRFEFGPPSWLASP